MTEYTPSALYGRIRYRGQPVAHHDAVVISGRARFTFLTSRLVRLEWSDPGHLCFSHALCLDATPADHRGRG